MLKIVVPINKCQKRGMSKWIPKLAQWSGWVASIVNPLTFIPSKPP